MMARRPRDPECGRTHLPDYLEAATCGQGLDENTELANRRTRWPDCSAAMRPQTVMASGRHGKAPTSSLACCSADSVCAHAGVRFSVWGAQMTAQKLMAHQRAITSE